MLQLQNNTPFAVDNAFFANEDAIDTLYILVRATFNIGKHWHLADEQLQPIVADEYWTEPAKSSIKYSSDYHTGKVCSDIIMLGHAFSPEGKDVHQLDVNLRVGEVHKIVRVFGEREWHNGQITQARSFKTMAMVYEKAFGGVHILDGAVKTMEQRNPVGRGFSGTRTVEEMNGVLLPNLEDPYDLISDINHKPNPACFGVSAPHWMPRAGYAGTYDDNWQKRRAPYLPIDFDKRFFSVAHPDLVYPGYLQGGERVEISNMHSNGNISFNLPRVHFQAEVSLDDALVRPRFNLETLLLEPNQLKASMLWRGAVRCDKKMLKISSVKVTTTK